MGTTEVRTREGHSVLRAAPLYRARKSHFSKAIGTVTQKLVRVAAYTLMVCFLYPPCVHAEPSLEPSLHPAFPLGVSANRRYLVDKKNIPFLIVGDAPQTLITNLSKAETAVYFANRKEYGINSLWINLLCNTSDGCNKDGKTFDGVSPFLIAGDLSTPNPEYFQRADDLIRMADESGLLIILDPIETSSWLAMLRANGSQKAFAYGQYLGTRYKNFANIIWMHGNDFQTWRNGEDDRLVQAVAKGIRSTDPYHLHTVELDYPTSGSLDDPSWAPLIELDAAYTYFPTYAQVLTEYNRSDFKPVFMVEGYYEFEHTDETGGGGSTSNLRRQEYWSMLSGAAGQLYGSEYSWRLENGWQGNLDTPGARQLRYMRDFFVSRKWYDLIPDQNHTLVTEDYDRVSGLIGGLTAYFGQGEGFTQRTFGRIRRRTGFGSLDTNTYVTAARTSDGTLAVAYLPAARPITIDLSKMAGPATVRWYDPTNGAYVDGAAAELLNSGERRLTPPGRNSAGDEDWVLLLEAQAHAQ